MNVTLTDKGERTRENLLDVALALFVSKGYEATTLRDIASAAGTSLGLVYRYVDGKEGLVLLLYDRITVDLEQFAANIPRGDIATRYALLIGEKLDRLGPYSDVLGAIFGPALSPTSGAGVLGPESAAVRSRMLLIVRRIVEGATDRPRPAQIEPLVTILYGAHLALIFFWLNDRTKDHVATRKLVAFATESLTLLRPMLRLPLFDSRLRKLSEIVGPVFTPTGSGHNGSPS